MAPKPHVRRREERGSVAALGEASEVRGSLVEVAGSKMPLFWHLAAVTDSLMGTHQPVDQSSFSVVGSPSASESGSLWVISRALRFLVM